MPTAHRFSMSTRAGHWYVYKLAQPEFPWTAIYSRPDELHPDSDAACISSGEHATWADAFNAALEGAALTDDTALTPYVPPE